MKENWHEEIQRYVAGDSTEEETAALQQALKDDAGLRALYLDYLNLEVALGVAAEMAMTSESGVGRIVIYPQAWPVLRHWRWLAATAVGAGAAGAALIVWTILPGHRDSPGRRQDIGAIISSSQNAIARLTFEPASSLPGWMSPTASMLQPPEIPK